MVCGQHLSLFPAAGIQHIKAMSANDGCLS
jgi:hypothetical protein